MEKVIKFLKEKGKYICVCFILLGLVVMGAGFAMADFDIYAMQTVKHEPFQTVTKTEEIDSLSAVSIDSYQSEITIEPSLDDKLHITYEENKEYIVDYEANGTTLQIKRKSSDFFKNGLGFRWFDFTNDETIHILIQLPKQYAGNVSIDNSYDDVTIHDLQTLENLEINNDQGEVSLNQVSAKDIHIEGGYDDVILKDVQSRQALNIKLNQGDISLDNIKSNALRIKSEYGKLIANQLEMKDDIKIEGNQVEIELGDVTAQNFFVESSYGDLQAGTMQIAKSMQFDMEQSSVNIQKLLSETLSIESEYGDVLINDLLASDIKINLDQGSVTAMIAEDMQSFAITSSSENGDNNLPPKYHEDAEKHLDVSTQYGDINIEFKN